MSHFSKIHTNINDVDNLVKTIRDLGLNHELIYDSSKVEPIVRPSRIIVYNPDKGDSPLFSFNWEASKYSIVVDLQLWHMGIDFSYFVDVLSQKYAYNTILKSSVSNGFSKVEENLRNDGSVQLVLRKWGNF